MSTDSSGSNNPADADAGDLSGDAAWLDEVWATAGGDPIKAARIQHAAAKHSNRVNVIYVDGHSTPSFASRLTWGQFYGVFAPGTPCPTSYSTTVMSDASISSPAYDSLEWSSTPE